MVGNPIKRSLNMITKFLSHLSTKAWWRRNMGSFAEACTEDIVPFMNTWMAACIPIRELFPKPFCGSPNPADLY